MRLALGIACLLVVYGMCIWLWLADDAADADETGCEVCGSPEAWAIEWTPAGADGTGPLRAYRCSQHPPEMPL